MNFTNLNKSFVLPYLIMEFEKHGYTAESTHKNGMNRLKNISRISSRGKVLTFEERYLREDEWRFLVDLSIKWLNKQNVHGVVTTNKLGKIVF